MNATLPLTLAALLGTPALAAERPDPHAGKGAHDAHAPAAHGHDAPGQGASGAARIPESMKVEHAEIHGELVRATRLKGRVGDAARALAEVLHPHFVREEEIALPPLGLLAPLAKAPPTPEMREVLKLTEALEAELPRMLEEHGRIGAAAKNLEAVARAAKNDEVVELAENLQLHAKTEEEVFYPAAVLVGKLVRAGP